jgi:hypothetical protein
LTLVAAESESALAAADEHLSDRRIINDDVQHRAARQIDLAHANFEFDAAAVKFKLSETVRQNSVQRRTG